jgi:hypothetical protein
MDWDREFLPWLASLPEEDQWEVFDLLLQWEAALTDRRFHGRVSCLEQPARGISDLVLPS